MLVKRGGCTFSEKAQAVDAARAAALIVYNNDEGQHCRHSLEQPVALPLSATLEGPHMCQSHLET